MKNIDIYDGNYEDLYNNIYSEFLQYVLDNKSIKSLVLGLSGGIDSAVVAILAQEVAAVAYEINVHTVYLPIEGNKIDEEKRAIRLGENLSRHHTAQIHPFSTEITKFNFDINYNPEYNYLNFRGKWIPVSGKLNDLDKILKIFNGNIKARLRMIELYSIAALNNGMVLSTDNLTEYYLGFWTLHGDVGDFGPIQGLWKTEVYKLAEYIRDNLTHFDQKILDALDDCIKAIPTDGLGITDSDFQQFGVASYQEIDKILINYFKNGKKDKFGIVERHLKSEFKRNNPFNLKRENLLKEI